MKLLSQKEVSRLLGVSIRSVYNLRNTGQLEYFIMNRTVRIPEKSVRKLLWQKSYHQGSNLESKFTTSTFGMENVQSDRHLGQKIFLKHKQGSLAG